MLSQLAPSETTDEKQKRRHKALSRRTALVARLLRRWLPRTDLPLLGDSTYSVIALGRSCQKRHVRLIAPPRTARTMGRRRKVGAALTKPHAMLSDPTTCWMTAEVSRPDSTRRPLELASGQAIRNESGEVPLPVRWVIARDPAGRRGPRPSFSTEPNDEAAEVVARFARRGTIEVTFRGGTGSLGCQNGAAVVWPVNRASNALLAGFVVGGGIADEGFDGRLSRTQTTAWDAKARNTIGDSLALVHQHFR